MIEQMVCTVERIIVNEKDWVDYVSAFGPVIAACIAIFVGVLQYILSKKQHNFHLLQEREKCKRDFLRLLRCPEAMGVDAGISERGFWLLEFEELANRIGVLYDARISQKMCKLYTEIEQQKGKPLNKKTQMEYVEEYGLIYKEICDFLKNEKCS